MNREPRVAAGRIDRRVARHLVGGELVIDVGCGDGTPLDDLANSYRLSVGFDISPERFLRRSVGAGRWSFVLTDLNRGIPAASCSADAIHANQVIEHMANPLRFMMEVHRVLRAGGVFIAMTPNIRYVTHIWRLVALGRGPLTSAAQTRTETDWDAGHIHFLTPSDLTWIARRVGFSEIETSALIATSGRFQLIRPVLDRLSTTAIVRNFLSGNTMLVAVK